MPARGSLTNLLRMPPQKHAHKHTQKAHLVLSPCRAKQHPHSATTPLERTAGSCRSNPAAACMIITMHHSHILHNPPTTTSLHDHEPPTATAPRTRLGPHRNQQHTRGRSVLWLWHHAGLHIPDVLGVLCNGAVCAELAGACGHHDAHARPLGLVLVRPVDLVLQQESSTNSRAAEMSAPGIHAAAVCGQSRTQLPAQEAFWHCINRQLWGIRTATTAAVRVRTCASR